MAKLEWGTKRVCKSCAAKFYDLVRSPILCPKCGAKFDPEALLKSRRPRSSVAAKPAKPAKEVPVESDAKKKTPEDEDELAAVIGDDSPEIADDDGDDDTLIADTSDLDEDDVVAVVKPGGGKDDT